jgi:hypothetical protein
MTKAEMIAALADLPDDAQIRINLEEDYGYCCLVDVMLAGIIEDDGPEDPAFGILDIEASENAAIVKEIVNTVYIQDGVT